MHSFLWTEPQLIPIMGIDTVGDIPNNFSEKRIFYNLFLKENEVGYISEEDKLENERIKLEDEALKQINATTAETDAPKSLHPSSVCGNLTDGIEGLNWDFKVSSRETKVITKTPTEFLRFLKAIGKLDIVDAVLSIPIGQLTKYVDEVTLKREGVLTTETNDFGSTSFKKR